MTRIREHLSFAAIVAAVLLILGSCSATAINCWRRGGTVLKNAFDWPTCVEVTRR